MGMGSILSSSINPSCHSTISNGNRNSSIDATTGGVLITWSNPSSNGNAITAYLIEIQATNSSWYADPTHCDGNSNTVFFSRQCVVPMNVITDGYALALNSLIQVRASAINTYGQSTPSYVNTLGARVRTVPVQMSTPTRGTDTSESEIQVNWASLTGTELVIRHLVLCFVLG